MRMTKREDFDEAAAARPLLSWLETTWEERFVELKRYNSHCFQEVIEVRMSAFGTKRTSEPPLKMSAFGGKADIADASRNVRY
jgi:hypothetical protein